MRSRHQFVWTTAVVNNCTRVAVITVQPLVAPCLMIFRADHPDNYVITAIGRSDKRRAATATGSSHTPTTGGVDRRRISPSNSERRNDGFAVAPVATSARRIARDNKRIHTISGDPANSPYCAAESPGVGGRGPCCYGGWIIHGHSYQPAMPETAIPHAPITNIKNVTHNAERRPLLLNRCSKVDAVV